MPVIRDFIPEGEELTTEEKQHFGLGEWKDLKSGIKPDFIPGPDHIKPQPRKSQEEIHKEISEAIARQGERELQTSYERATKVLPGLTVAEAAAMIEQLPPGLRGVWLLAEEQGLARKTLLSQFMRPDDVLRERLGIEEK